MIYVRRDTRAMYTGSMATEHGPCLHVLCGSRSDTPHGAGERRTMRLRRGRSDRCKHAAQLRTRVVEFGSETRCVVSLPPSSTVVEPLGEK